MKENSNLESTLYDCQILNENLENKLQENGMIWVAVLQELQRAELQGPQ